MVAYEPYTMADVAKIERNGLTVASTFSGGGGSSLGYKLAGFDVLYANEFISEAQNTYRANFPDTFLDTRDIREVSPEDVLEACGGAVDVLDGSPPCCSFSIAGSGSKGWGKVRDYSDSKQRVDDLFFEWLRLLEGIRPKGFLCENVPALAQGKNKGVFKQIVAAMRELGYLVEARIVCAEYLGVPQKRHRLLVMGVRRDIGAKPTFPAPFPTKCTLGSALEGIDPDSEEGLLIEKECASFEVTRKIRLTPKNPGKVAYAKDFMDKAYGQLVRASMHEPAPTFVAFAGKLNASSSFHPLRDRKFTISEAKRIQSLPDDFILTGTYRQKIERIGRMVPPKVYKEVASCLANALSTK